MFSLTKFGFSFRFSSRWHRSARKGPCALRPVSQQSPQGCPRNSASVCLVEHRSLPTSEVGMSAASFLHSSFLQAISALMLCPVHVQKVPQASEHICPTKLQTRCDICPFIPTDSGVLRAVDPKKCLQPKTVHGHVPFGAAHSRVHFLQVLVLERIST